MTIIFWFLALLLSYLIGSIPTGFLMAKKLKGIDIRTVGSGNMGASNVIRTLGKIPGILTLVIDMAKGLVSVLGVARIFHGPGIHFSDMQLACAVASIAGHNWTCFLNFKGGKGVATSAGAFFGLAPLVTLCLVAVWSFVAFSTRYISVASIIASMALPVLLFLFDKPLSWVVTGFILSWVSIWKHRGNIKRLMAGTENRIGKGSRQSIVDGR
ncbi:MAG: glycerol-3-phosphate 1-O-acyltransferase PlsY [Chlamydiae bacterium]|nr:glycerol-3-phosphate 1-O-acyltransferase PlsY [Chlamydiota bacterium]